MFQKSLYLATALLLSLSAFGQQDGFFTSQVSAQKKFESDYLKAVNYDRFKIHLTELTKSPHIAGTPENELVKDYMVDIMSKAGMEVKVWPYDVYLPNHPGKSELQIISPVQLTLSQKEGELAEDPFSTDPRLHLGFNAFSGSGDVTAEVVYVNYGTREDFMKLVEMGVPLKGKVAIARYGGNFRGYKAKFAEQNGMIGLVVYTDPKDSGFTRGDVYPKGPFYNETTIQRGSMLTLDFTGDPLTPNRPALPLDGPEKIKRDDPATVDFHTIPVTPIGYGAAKEILSRMTGADVPAAWQGGLPFTYKLTGGADLKVRVMVDQKPDFIRANNVVGTFIGKDHPDEWIILGSHYDAWSFGATDPNSGTAMLLTNAPGLSEDLVAILATKGLAYYFGFYLVGGYLIYACVFTAIGAFCETTREAQTLVGPMMLILSIPMIFMSQSITHPDMPIIKILCWVPPFTPFMMMVRAASGPTLFELVGTGLGMAAFIAITLWLSGKAFRVGALSTSKLDPKVMILGILRRRPKPA